MKSAPRIVLLTIACAAGALLAGADRVPALPALPALRSTPPAFDGAGSTPSATGEIVAPTFPTWLPPVPLAQTPRMPQQRNGPVRLSIAAVDASVVVWSPGNLNALAVAGGAAPRRLVFAVGPRTWIPVVDLSQPYLMWLDPHADAARPRLISDPTSYWSTQDALRASVPLRDSAVPYLRFSVPVPVEPGSTIQSLPPAPEEPLPPQPSQILGPRPRQL